MINKISNQPFVIDISMTLNTIPIYHVIQKNWQIFFKKKEKDGKKNLINLYAKKNNNYPYIFPNFWLKK